MEVAASLFPYQLVPSSPEQSSELWDTNRKYMSTQPDLALPLAVIVLAHARPKCLIMFPAVVRDLSHKLVWIVPTLGIQGILEMVSWALAIPWPTEN